MQQSQVVAASATEYLMPGDAAALLCVTTTTLAKWADAGSVQAIRLPGGHRRYSAASIRALAEKGTAA